jgi:hypothetical protein
LRLVLGDRLLPAAENIGVGHRFDLADLVKQVRAEQHAIALLEEHARIPPVRQVGRRHPPEPMTAGLDHLARCQAARRAVAEVFEIHRGAQLAAGRLCIRRNREPLVERSALVHLEVAPADPPQRRGIDHASHRVPHFRKHLPHARVKQERFRVADEEVVELQVELRNVDGNAKQVLGDFVDLCSHGGPPSVRFIEEVSRLGRVLQKALSGTDR